jgi:DNA-binding NtrC family response regulator
VRWTLCAIDIQPFGDGERIVTQEGAGTVLRAIGESEPAAASGSGMGSASGNGNGNGNGSGNGRGAVAGLDETLDKLEVELLVKALTQTRGNKAKAARMLGVTERVIGLRLKKYGIDFWAFRTASNANGL